MSKPCHPARVPCCALLDEHPTMVPGEQEKHDGGIKWGTMVGQDDQDYWKTNWCNRRVGGPSKTKCPCPDVKGRIR